MKYLLDTSVFLKTIFDEVSSISTKAQEIINRNEELFLSTVSMWEIVIKYDLGKLDLLKAPEKLLPPLIQEMNLDIQNIYSEHIFQLRMLAKYHRDPFDRLLIAQAQVENMTIITTDSQFQKYQVPIIY